jgi:hypothetical protein
MLAGMSGSTTTMENSMEAPQKTKHRFATLRDILEGM